MKQKKLKNVKNNDKDGTYELFHTRQKRIKKTQTNKKKQKDQNSEDEQQNQNLKQSNKSEQPQKGMQNKQPCIQNELMKDQSEIKTIKQVQTFSASQSKLTSLAKLNQNFQQMKAIHEQNISKYNYHKNECQQLSQKVNESNSNIEAKAKQLRELSKSIYIDSVRNLNIQFLNPNTFTDSNRLESYIKNLTSIVDNLTNCPYEDPLENLKLTKINPETFLIHKQITIGRHKKEKVIKDHLGAFPYITAGPQFIDVIQALLSSTKYVEKQQGCPIQQFPCLFVRPSGLSFSVIQKILNVIYKLISDSKTKLIKNIQHIAHQICPQGTDVSIQNVSELVYKGITQTKFICLPQAQFQIRGFSYGGFIFINTYYIEKDQSISKDVYVAYCVLTLIRQLANFVVNSLIYCLNKNQEDIGKSISEIRERTDAGSKLEKLITNGHNFVCASAEDYKHLMMHDQKLSDLGKNNSEYGASYLFQQQRKRKEIFTSSLISKYDTRKNNDKNNTHLNDKKSDHQQTERRNILQEAQQRKEFNENENEFLRPQNENHKTRNQQQQLMQKSS